jgi:hypothetical protein
METTKLALKLATNPHLFLRQPKPRLEHHLQPRAVKLLARLDRDEDVVQGGRGLLLLPRPRPVHHILHSAVVIIHKLASVLFHRGRRRGKEQDQQPDRHQRHGQEGERRGRRGQVHATVSVSRCLVHVKCS